MTDGFFRPRTAQCKRARHADCRKDRGPDQEWCRCECHSRPPTCSEVSGYSPEDQQIPGPPCLDPERCDGMAYCWRDWPPSIEEKHG